MAAQRVGASAFQPSATCKVAEATVAPVDATAMLLPHHQSSYYSLKVPGKRHDKSLTRCMMTRAKQLLTRGSSPALHLVSKAKELLRHCLHDEVYGASKVGNALTGTEAYFSIPVVVPVTSNVI